MGNRPRKYTFREMTRILKRNGYSLARISGDHYLYSKEGSRFTISVPIKLNKIIGLKIIKRYNIDINA